MSHVGEPPRRRRVFASRGLRIAYIPVFLLFTFLCSCTSKSMVQPLSADRVDFNKFIAITVVDQAGQKQTFRKARVENGVLYGIDAEGEVRAVELDKVWYIEVERTDAGKTIVAIIGVPLLILGGVAVLFLAIAAATSCPQVFSYDGEKWILDAEPYSGAIAKSCPRADRQVLDRIRPCDGSYKILVAGKAGEVEFTDELKLIAVDADSSVEILPDGNGGMMGIGPWELPLRVETGKGKDLTSRLSPGGEFHWEGDPTAGYGSSARPREELYLEFRKPVDAERGTFLLRGNNTLWASHVMREYLGRYGSGARKKLERLNTDPDAAAKVEKLMKKDGGWIEVQLFREGEWRTVGYIRDVGSPSVIETIPLRLDLAGIPGETVQIRLRWGPMFWNILKVGMDFSPAPHHPQVCEIVATTAIDSKRGDIRALLSASDGRSYRAEAGDEAVLTFAAPPPVPGMNRTVVLKASGYYNLLLPEGGGSGVTQIIADLVRRRGMDVFSRDLLMEMAERKRKAG